MGGERSLLLLLGLLVAAAGLTLTAAVLDPEGLLAPLGWVTLASAVVLGAVIIIEGVLLAPRNLTFGAILLRICRQRAVWWIVGAGLAASLTLVWVLRAFPNSGDEYDYLFQAKTFLAGRLWNPVPPQHEFFAFYWQSFHDGKWTTGYPPGWPLLLAAGMGLKLPAWLVSPLAGAVLLFALFKLGQRRAGTLAGLLAVMLVAVSPFFLFNAASYFMHIPAAAAGVGFCWAGIAFLDRPRPGAACLAGLALGVLGLIRPEDVPLFALPFAVEFLWRARGAHYRLAPLLIMAGLPFLGALVFYHYAIAGSFLPHTGSTTFGIHSVDGFGIRHTPLDQLRYVALRAVMFVEWSSVFLALGYIAAFAWGAWRLRLRFVDFVFPAFVVGYMLVPFFGGNQYGPRYYFEGYPLLVLTVVPPLARALGEAAGRRGVQIAGSVVAAHVGFCVLATIHFGLLFHQMVDQRMDLYDQARAQGLRDALVVIRSSTGVVLPMQPRDLTRNGIALDGKVIYALDIPGRLGELRQAFPHRRFYVYERQPDASRGTLRPLG